MNRTCATCRHAVPCSERLDDTAEPVAWCNVHGEHRTVTDTCRWHAPQAPHTEPIDWFDVGMLAAVIGVVLILLGGLIWEATR